MTQAAVMLLPIRFWCGGVWIPAGNHCINATFLTICTVIFYSRKILLAPDFPESNRCLRQAASLIQYEERSVGEETALSKKNKQEKY